MASLRSRRSAPSAFYWNARYNFGDQLSPLVLNHFLGLDVSWAPPESADIVCAGSVIDQLAPEWAGTVLGAGKLHARPQDLRKARVLALRGPLTGGLLRTKSNDYALGDPGLLANELVGSPRKCIKLGVVPHWSDLELFDREDAQARRYGYARPVLISPRQNVLEVIRQIGACEKIIASSLHGVIVADSFGIPRRTEMFHRMSSPYEGGVFKFNDYASLVGVPLKFGELQQVDPARIDRVRYELFDAFQAA